MADPARPLAFGRYAGRPPSAALVHLRATTTAPAPTPAALLAAWDEVHASWLALLSPHHPPTAAASMATVETILELGPRPAAKALPAAPPPPDAPEVDAAPMPPLLPPFRWRDRVELPPPAPPRPTRHPLDPRPSTSAPVPCLPLDEARARLWAGLEPPPSPLTTAGLAARSGHRIDRWGSWVPADAPDGRPPHAPRVALPNPSAPAREEP